jgi:hypothetical protein
MQVKDYIEEKLEFCTGVPPSGLLQKTEVSPPPSELGELCPSTKDCEPEGEEQNHSNNESDNHCIAPTSNDEPGSSPSEIDDTPAAGDSGASGEVGTHQKLCSDCRKFQPSPEEPDKGTCEKYPKPFLVGKVAICSDFKSKDSAYPSDPAPEVPAEMDVGQTVNKGG